MEARTAGMQARAGDTTEVVGRRIGAQIVDGIVVWVGFLVIGVVSGGGNAGHGQVGVTLRGGGFLVWLGLWFLYHAICEGASGQTLGKRLLGIRVVASDGSPAGFGRAIVRTVLRLVDSLPVLYIVGFVSIFATGAQRRQRVGDLAAGTIVVASD